MKFLWEQFTNGEELSSAFTRMGGSLAALRRGMNVEPGALPELWQYYTQLNDQGHLTKRLRSEHACLVTYGVHQQGQQSPVHREGASFGEALRALKRTERFSGDAVDRRVSQLATAQTFPEMTRHLTSLVSLMKATGQNIGFNYTYLFHDLIDLQSPSTAGRVRRRWGAAYFAHRPTASKEG